MEQRVKKLKTDLKDEHKLAKEKEFKNTEYSNVNTTFLLSSFIIFPSLALQ